MTAIALANDPRSAAELGEFGYHQQLHRSIGSYASFAAGFSFVSILTTVFQLFGFGYSFGGPVFFWTWPAVFVGQLTVALCFAELAARYPLSGAIYQWSRRLGGHIVGLVRGVDDDRRADRHGGRGGDRDAGGAAVDLVGLPDRRRGSRHHHQDGATNAVILGVIVLVATTIINAVGVRVMAIVNSVGVTCELVGRHAAVRSRCSRRPSADRAIVLHTAGVGHGSGTLSPPCWWPL